MDHLTIAALIISLSLVGLLCGYVLGWKMGPTWEHGLKFKRLTLDCPACRDDETGKPTGLLTPKNRYLAAEAQRADVAFDCATCGGTKRVTYEYPRSASDKIDVTAEGRLASPLGDTTEIRQVTAPTTKAVGFDGFATETVQPYGHCLAFGPLKGGVRWH